MPSRIPGRRLSIPALILLALSLLAAPAHAGERAPGDGDLALWLLGLSLVAPPPPARLDLNTATVDELRGVPGLELRQVRRIVGQRPFAKLEDLSRIGLSSRSIERLARFLFVDPEWPSALPGQTPRR